MTIYISNENKKKYGTICFACTEYSVFMINDGRRMAT